MSSVKSTKKDRAPKVESKATGQHTAGRDSEEAELEVEELEERIAPKLASNHNETLLLDH